MVSQKGAQLFVGSRLWDENIAQTMLYELPASFFIIIIRLSLVLALYTLISTPRPKKRKDTELVGAVSIFL